LNSGSIVMTSGSTYVVGLASGDQSRGGVVIVLAGSAGLPAGGACALATMGASAVVPASTPTALTNFLRVTTLPSSMAVLLDRRDVSAACSAAFNDETVSGGSGKSQGIPVIFQSRLASHNA
jgi:hypothetical protein